MISIALNVYAGEVSCRTGTIKCSRCIIVSPDPIRRSEWKFWVPRWSHVMRPLSRQRTGLKISRRRQNARGRKITPPLQL